MLIVVHILGQNMLKLRQSEAPIHEDVPGTALQGHLIQLTHSLGHLSTVKEVDADELRG